MKYLRFERAMKNRLYVELIDKAKESLSTVGWFRNTDLLERAGYGVELEDSVRWDYVARQIETELNVELIPLALKWFKLRPKQRTLAFDFENVPGAMADERIELRTIANSYIAGGNGRRAAGYASVDKGNKGLVIRKLELRGKMIQGQIKGHNRSREIAKQTADVDFPGWSDTPSLTNDSPDEELAVIVDPAPINLTVKRPRKI
jgi:hypothetical protein